MDRQELSRDWAAGLARTGQNPIASRAEASRWFWGLALGLVAFVSPLAAHAQHKWTTMPTVAPEPSLTPPPAAPTPAAPLPVAPAPVPPPSPGFSTPAPTPAMAPGPAGQPAAPVQTEPYPEEQPAITMRLEDVPLAQLKPEEQLMDFASFGLRLGCQLDHLKTAEGSAPLDSMKLFNDESFAVALTAHFGRSGYFTRLDVPAAIGAHTGRVGLGFYPVGVGYLFPNARVMPYLGAGVLGGMIYALLNTSSQTTNSTHQRFGLYGQVRTVLGMKVFPARHFALSFEFGYSPYIIGYLPKDTAVAPKKSYPGETGMGMTWDTNIGVEWH